MMVDLCTTKNQRAPEEELPNNGACPTNRLLPPPPTPLVVGIHPRDSSSISPRSSPSSLGYE